MPPEELVVDADSIVVTAANDPQIPVLRWCSLWMRTKSYMLNTSLNGIHPPSQRFKSHNLNPMRWTLITDPVEKPVFG